MLCPKLKKTIKINDNKISTFLKRTFCNKLFKDAIIIQRGECKRVLSAFELCSRYYAFTKVTLI